LREALKSAGIDYTDSKDEEEPTGISSKRRPRDDDSDSDDDNGGGGWSKVGAAQWSERDRKNFAARMGALALREVDRAINRG